MEWGGDLVITLDLWRLTGRIDSLWEERVQRVHAAGKTAIAVCMKQRPRLNKDGAVPFRGRPPRCLQAAHQAQPSKARVCDLFGG